MLHIITACIRPENLARILDSFKDAHTSEPTLPLIWWVVVDKLAIEFFRKNFNFSIYLEALQSLTAKLPFLTLKIIEHHDLRSPSNPALNKIKNGYVCWVDDDNIMHPQFLKVITPYLKENKSLGLLYYQNLGKEPKQTNRNVRIVYPYRIKPGAIDTAQFTLHRKLIGKARWECRLEMKHLNKPKDQNPDGIFIKTIYDKHADKFKIIKHTICYHNYLAVSNLDFN